MLELHLAIIIDEILGICGNCADYGSSFSDVVQGLEHALESLGSHQSMMPSSFKYKDNLEKQVWLKA